MNTIKTKSEEDPPEKVFFKLIEYQKTGNFKELLGLAEKLVKDFPRSYKIWNIL